MPLNTQKDVSAMVASITSTQEVLAPLVDVKSALIYIKSRLYARSLDKNHSLAMGKGKSKGQTRFDIQKAKLTGFFE